MSPLQSLIQTKIPNWAESTPSAILDELTQPGHRRLPKDQARHNAAELAELLGGKAVERLVAAVSEVGYPVMASALVAHGLDFGHPELQTLLTQLGERSPDIFDAETVARLKSLGVDSRSALERAGLPTIAVDDVAKLLETMKAEEDAEALRGRFWEAFNNTVLPALRDQPTDQSVEAALDDLRSRWTATS